VRRLWKKRQSNRQGITRQQREWVGVPIQQVEVLVWLGHCLCEGHAVLGAHAGGRLWCLHCAWLAWRRLALELKPIGYRSMPMKGFGKLEALT
jgi:hypothetical protein